MERERERERERETGRQVKSEGKRGRMERKGKGER